MRQIANCVDRRRRAVAGLAVAVLLVACSSGGTVDDARVGGDSELVADLSPKAGYYLRGAAIIDGTGADPLTGYAIVVRGERIVALEPESVEVAPGLTRVDLDGLTVLPGFVDVHMHVATIDDPQLALDRELDFGVTAIKDVAGPIDVLVAMRDEVEAGARQGPRMKITGQAFTAPEGHPLSTIFAGDAAAGAQVAIGVTDEGFARQEVRRLHAAGADQIKCVLTDVFDSAPRLDEALLAAVADEATQLGLRTVVHTDSVEDIEAAIAAGAYSLEHGLTEGEIDASLAQTIANSGVYYVQTASLVSQYRTSSKEAVLANYATLRVAGAKVAVGTDASNFGVTLGATYHQELELMVEGGYTEMEALVAATAVGAEHLELGDDIGTLEAGKLADIIAVDGDPLADISVTRDVRWVMRGGEPARDKR